jgi:hypothetical protein
LVYCALHSKPRFLPARDALAAGEPVPEPVSGEEDAMEEESPVKEPELVEYELQRQANIARLAAAKEIIFTAN